MLTRLFERFTKSATLLLGFSAILVGLGTGAGVWLFKWLFGGLQQLLHASANPWLVVLIPIAGGALVGLVAQYLIGEEKLHGTAGIMQSVALTGGRLPYQKLPIRTLAAVLSIGSGASVGPEDPSVQIGANLGSLLGQLFHRTDDTTSTLVAAGAASAIAAAFNAPIAGIFFALEIILGEISSNALWIILVAAVTSSVFTQAVAGSSPAFQIPSYSLNSLWELPLYLLLGLAAGPISALYVWLLYKLQDLFGAWHAPRPFKTASVGALLGLVGLFLPGALGVGYDTIGQVLNQGNLGLGLLLTMLVAKLILTPASLGGGFFGGVFAPSLFIGAALGGAFGTLVNLLLPGLGVNPAAYALVGMAAVLAGAVHAPLTAVLLLFEMTGDYHIILPLIFAVAVSLLVSQRIRSDSVYALGLARHGVRLDRGRDVYVLSLITVGEAMQSAPETLPEDLPLTAAAARLAASRHHGLPVVDARGRLSGILTIDDIECFGEAGTVGQACTRQVETAYPAETLNLALQRMSRRNIGRLPVVAREDPGHLLGVLRRSDVIKAYDTAVERRTAQRHHEASLRLAGLTPARVEVTDVTLEDGAPAAGQALSAVTFPPGCLVASLRRGGQVIVPGGSTVLAAGDVLVVVAEGAALEAVLRLCRRE